MATIRSSKPAKENHLSTLCDATWETDKELFELWATGTMDPEKVTEDEDSIA